MPGELADELGGVFALAVRAVCVVGSRDHTDKGRELLVAILTPEFVDRHGVSLQLSDCTSVMRKFKVIVVGIPIWIRRWFDLGFCIVELRGESQ